MVYWVLLFAFGVISVALFIFLRLRGVGIKALIAKTVAALFYILLSISGCAIVGYPRLGVVIVVGQIFGLLGDIFLDQKYIHPRYSEAYTRLGFIVFGIGHMFFISGLMTHYGFSLVEIGVSTLCAGLISLFAYYTRKPFKLTFGKMKLDVVIYSFILGLSTMLPLIWIIFNGVAEPQINIYFGGMVAFLLSDLVLSQIYFGENKNNGPYVLANYVLYFAAQYAVAISIVFIKS